MFLKWGTGALNIDGVSWGRKVAVALSSVDQFGNQEHGVHAFGNGLAHKVRLNVDIRPMARHICISYNNDIYKLIDNPSK